MMGWTARPLDRRRGGKRDAADGVKTGRDPAAAQVELWRLNKNDRLHRCIGIRRGDYAFVVRPAAAGAAIRRRPQRCRA